MNNCINSSKVYCKYRETYAISEAIAVLIVAKCIVNLDRFKKRTFGVMY